MDTIMIICDSVATCINKTAEVCQPCVKEAKTNCLDVAIWGLICLSLAFVVWYAIHRYFKWKDDERIALASAAEEKRKQEGIISENKQQADLLSKLLNFKEELTKKEVANKLDEKASITYIKELKYLITRKTLPEDEKEAKNNTTEVR